MAADDLVSNLDFWSGRARSTAADDATQKPLPSFRRRSRLRVPGIRIPAVLLPRRARIGTDLRGRARPIAAAVLLAGLTGAWLIVGHAAHRSATAAPPAVAPVSPVPTAAAPTSTTRTTTPAPTTTPTTIPSAADCRGLSSVRPELRCVRDRIALDVRLLTSATVAAAYRRATGTNPVARTGPPACALGVPDERAWSSAAAPISAIGRYRCRLEHGRAAMWWTEGDRLVHAVAPDADLAALFSWWRAHPSE